ncbi:MAG: HD domain-containing phosphohydrolase [Pseudomonadota bacterium]
MTEDKSVSSSKQEKHIVFYNPQNLDIFDPDKLACQVKTVLNEKEILDNKNLNFILLSLANYPEQLIDFFIENDLLKKTIIISDELESEDFTKLFQKGLYTFTGSKNSHLLIQNEIIKLSSAIKPMNSQEKINLLTELNTIGVALSSERDIHSLMDLILTETRNITQSDAGSIYLKSEKNPNLYPEDEKLIGIETGASILRFKTAQSDSMKINLQEYPLPLDLKSIAGFVGITGSALNIKDAYQMDPNLPIQHNDEFDRQMNYITRSVLAIPMKNRTGEVIGIIQLINKKDSTKVRLPQDEIKNYLNSDKKINPSSELLKPYVFSFDDNDIEIALSIASQAAVALETAILYEQIHSLFENFIETMGDAIDRRDTVTSGHSKRMAQYALKIAAAINTSDKAPYKNVFFTADELRSLKYAALLHDVGKIGVPDSVMNKRTRLPDGQEDTIVNRLKLIDIISKRSHTKASDINEYSFEILSLIENVKKWNIADFIPDDAKKEIQSFNGKEIIDLDGLPLPYLTNEDAENLSIKAGTLNAEERKIIEGHMNHTIGILSTIPWPKELGKIPEIAGSHHERIDGSGYPNGLDASQIPLEGKILAVVDIFEAITAHDRPYKPPMPIAKALSILKMEAENNKLDKDIVNIFIEEKLYEDVIAN